MRYILKNLFLILIVLFSIGITTPVIAQAKGGRKREHKNQKKSSFHNGISRSRSKSKGNADLFARGGKSNGLFYRLFHKSRGGAWVYKPTRPGKKQDSEQPHLFSRFRTKNKRFKDGIQAKQNASRSKRRIRGNATFSRRKY